MSWWLSPTPLKNDGVRQLGWWHSQLNGSKPPIRYRFKTRTRDITDITGFLFQTCSLFYFETWKSRDSGRCLKFKPQLWDTPDLEWTKLWLSHTTRIHPSPFTPKIPCGCYFFQPPWNWTKKKHPKNGQSLQLQVQRSPCWSLRSSGGRVMHASRATRQCLMVEKRVAGGFPTPNLRLEKALKCPKYRGKTSNLTPLWQ